MKKILIIEDEETLLSMLASKLTREGYEVVTAVDGAEGLDKVRSEHPDLVLLDIIMPKKGGFEVLEEMHGDKELADISVMIISNSGQPVEIEKAKALGVKDYLIKAEFDPQEVVGKVRRLLGDGPIEDKDASENSQSKPEEGGDGEIKKSPKAGEETSSEDEKTVLVIEDDQFLRDLIVRKLEEEGFKTLQAIDGEEGLRTIRENKPKIVLLDLILPGIDGFEVLKQMKEDPTFFDVPVIVLSNLGQKDDIDRGLKLGALDYLIKAHFTPGEIVEKVKEALGM